MYKQLLFYVTLHMLRQLLSRVFQGNLFISVFDKQASKAVGHLTWCKHLPKGVLCDIYLHMANCASTTHRASAVPEINIITRLSQLIYTTERLHVTLHRHSCKAHCRNQQSQTRISVDSCGYLSSTQNINKTSSARIWLYTCCNAPISQ